MNLHNALIIIEFSSLFFQANGEASLGKYGGGVVGAGADASLFVANHAY